MLGNNRGGGGGGGSEYGLPSAYKAGAFMRSYARGDGGEHGAMSFPHLR